MQQRYIISREGRGYIVWDRDLGQKATSCIERKDAAQARADRMNGVTGDPRFTVRHVEDGFWQVFDNAEAFPRPVGGYRDAQRADDKCRTLNTEDTRRA